MPQAQICTILIFLHFYCICNHKRHRQQPKTPRDLLHIWYFLTAPSWFWVGFDLSGASSLGTHFFWLMLLANSSHWCVLTVSGRVSRPSHWIDICIDGIWWRLISGIHISGSSPADKALRMILWVVGYVGSQIGIRCILQILSVPAPAPCLRHGLNEESFFGNFIYKYMGVIENLKICLRKGKTFIWKSYKDPLRGCDPRYFCYNLIRLLGPFSDPDKKK